MVYVPFVSPLGKRKGGGKGGGGKASGSTSSGGTSSSSGGTKGSISSGGTSKTTSTYGGGTTVISTIPSGQMFAGRQTGGGTRPLVYGTPFYGSGYPIGYYPGGVYHHGVVGRGFPFFFWPIVWGTTAGFGAAYLWASLLDYGAPNNGSRPGGPEMYLRIESPNATQVYYLVADRDTVNAMVDPLQSNCTTINNKPLASLSFDGSTGQPKPESTIQYYRASSVALTLDGYNNTASFSDDESLPASPLPSGINQTFLDCVNMTIGAAVPLVDAAVSIQVQQQAFWMMCVALLVAVRNAW